MFLANLSKREKLLLCSAAGFILLSLFYNFAVKPLITEWSRVNDEILEKEIILKRNIRYLQQRDSVSSTYLRYAEYLKKKDSKVSDEEEMAALLNEVERIARGSSVHITDIKPRPVKELLFCKRYFLEMDCEATMEKYVEFIYGLHQSLQLIRVERLKLTSQVKGKSLLKAHMFITKVAIAD